MVAGAIDTYDHRWLTPPRSHPIGPPDPPPGTPDDLDTALIPDPLSGSERRNAR